MRAKRRSKSAVYIYPLRFAGRILRQGRPVRLFFGLNPNVREIFHDPYVFYDF